MPDFLSSHSNVISAKKNPDQHRARIENIKVHKHTHSELDQLPYKLSTRSKQLITSYSSFSLSPFSLSFSTWKAQIGMEMNRYLINTRKRTTLEREWQRLTAKMETNFNMLLEKEVGLVIPFFPFLQCKYFIQNITLTTCLIYRLSLMRNWPVCLIRSLLLMQILRKR